METLLTARFQRKQILRRFSVFTDIFRPSRVPFIPPIFRLLREIFYTAYNKGANAAFTPQLAPRV